MSIPFWMCNGLDQHVACREQGIPGHAGFDYASDEPRVRVGPVASWKDLPMRFGPAVRRLVEADEPSSTERMIVAAVQDPGES
jgi:hypothetical protein